MKGVWETVSKRFVAWLRQNPLGPALTVTLTGLVSVFVVPQLTLIAFSAPRLVLVEVLLGVLAVPYAVYRVHGGSPRTLAILWAVVFGIGLLRVPIPILHANPLALAGHMTVWFFAGFALTAGYSFLRLSANAPSKPAGPSFGDLSHDRTPVSKIATNSH